MKPKLGRSGKPRVLLMRLSGGLGNQLFEYAAARALSLRNNVPLWLDTISGFRDDVYGRAYALGAFNVVNERPRDSQSGDLGLMAELFRKIAIQRESWRMRYLGSYFDPALYNLRIKRPTLLNTHCQSPRYFCEIEDVVRRDLEFRTTPPGLSEAVVGEITQTNSVCLHLRRLHGQHANGSRPQAVADYYGASGPEYYRSAIRKIATIHGQLSIFLFSDDIDWARENAKAFEIGNNSVRVIHEEDTLRSFYLMRQCKHFVIANSTFSWWAAWLGQHAKKTVCVPPVWNQKERRFPADLFPPDWKILPAAAAHASEDLAQLRAGRRILNKVFPDSAKF